MANKTSQAARPAGAELGRDLSDAVVMFHEAIAQQLDLTAADHKVLGIIAREGPFTAGKLAHRIGLTPGAVTGLMDRLERAGFVNRLRDLTDRRRIQIAAVPRQSEHHAAAFAALSKGMRGFMRRYTPDQLATIDDFCRQTIRVLQQETRRLSTQSKSAK
jgi:DNA-binding MarR family transcriptional regulator